jgi:hypothetical protein
MNYWLIYGPAWSITIQWSYKYVYIGSPTKMAKTFYCVCQFHGTNYFYFALCPTSVDIFSTASKIYFCSNNWHNFFIKPRDDVFISLELKNMTLISLNKDDINLSVLRGIYMEPKKLITEQLYGFPFVESGFLIFFFLFFASKSVFIIGWRLNTDLAAKMLSSDSTFQFRVCYTDVEYF